MSFLKFLSIGFLIAFLEEFITQGVLKNNLIIWIIPTFIAFIPFLIIMYFVGKFLDKRYKESKANLLFYIKAGSIGLLVEWFLIGLAPWKNPGNILLVLFFNLGMFSFWGSVAFAPRLLLDKKDKIKNMKKWFKRFLIAGFLLIYFAAFTTPKENKFTNTILCVLFVFISLNFFYYRYIKKII